MKIFVNTYPVAFQCPGGGEIQLLKSKEALERRGHEVVLYDQWTHKLSDADVIHQFSVQGGIYNLCAYAHGQRIPLVLSPILWLSEYIDQYPMGEIGYMTSVADVICPNSQAEVDRFLKHFDAPAGKYHVTHNGVDREFFDSVPASLFLAEYRIERPFILCVGNIEVRKNQLTLLRAADSLNLHVVLIGNVRDTEYFAQLNAEFSGRFSYLGYFEHTSPILRSAYSACSAFALPSLLETPGLAALEAAAAGAPLVITQEGCTEEYFGEAAYYVDPKSVEDISEKLLAAVNSKRDAVELCARVMQFTWDRVAEELEQAYLKAQSIVRVSRLYN
ncbi:D-inositol 3-phosphate glycosyltransferase [Ferrovum sp. JA12]|uniref:glycosyltransferase n=1 Tax=Ferrovum sp. JA12 TaxID=1356299 RepID=UPI000703261E|nr:glycosyltransferase [Ferrovum sp. JA12]KRH79049.1 D-inositol 3-phosphate glycosyltransferase [Ferrovum sp. JA12]